LPTLTAGNLNSSTNFTCLQRLLMLHQQWKLELCELQS